MAAKYKILTGSDSLYYFHLQGDNNEKLLQSEGYTTKANAKNGIASVRVHSPTDANYVRLNSGGSIWFRLKATNGETLGRSETYSSETARETGIAAVKKHGPSAPLEE